MLADILEKVAEHEDPGVPWDWTAGICHNIASLERLGLAEYDAELLDAMAYPVPSSPDALHGTGYENLNGVCYEHLTRRTDVYTGTYGRSRREFARQLAEKLR